MKLHLPYSFLVFILFTVQLRAQPNFHYLDKLTVEDGLSSNSVTDVEQDGNGFLWIATSYGLNRYDGTEIRKFFAGKNSICDNEIRDMALLDSFHLAMATSHGLSILDTRNNIFRNIFFESKPELLPYNNNLKTLAKDNLGNLWVASLSNLYRFDSSFHLKKIFSPHYSSDELDKTRIRYIQKIIPLESGDVLLWSFNGGFIWNHVKDRIENMDVSFFSPWRFLKGVTYAECFKIMGHYLLAFKQDKLVAYDEQTGDTASCQFSREYHDEMEFTQKVSDLQNGWLAFSLEKKGVAYIKLSHENNKLQITLDSAIYFPDYTLRKWLKDNEGNWWITTENNGLKKISPYKQLFTEKKIISPKTGKQSTFEITGYSRIGDKLFISTYGDGFYESDNSLDKLVHFIPAPDKSFQNNIWNIRHYKNNILWVGTSGGLILFDEIHHTFSSLKLPHPSELDTFTITTQFVDSKGLLWMGVGTGHGLCVYNSSTEKFAIYPNKEGAYPFRYPLSISEDQDSNLWFLSDNTHDLVTWNRKTEQFKIVPLNLANGRINFPTGNMYLDQKGIAWYGVSVFGLISYNTHTGETESYGVDKGSNGNQIYNITEDKFHRLWLATDQGLSVFDPAIKRFVNYTTNDGLPSKSCSSHFFYDSATATMFTGSPGSIIYFSPANFKLATRTMKVMITRILVNNQPEIFSEVRALKLSPKENNITIYFTGINLTNGVENKYSYRFGNKEPKWIDIGNQRQINFASLKPGTFEFQVRAAGKDGNWSSITDHLRIVISPPFTATIWFYMIILLVISGGIYGWYRYRLAQLMKVEKIRAGISHDLHDEIGSRLTNISIMSMVASRQSSGDSQQKQWLEKIKEESQAVSQSMREIVWHINPENDSLEEAFPRMLRYTTDLLEAKGIDVNASIGDLDGTKMDMEKRRDLFLIFKEAIQNILKHADAHKVSINLKIKNSFMILKVSDDGKGFNSQKLSFLNGLEYIQQRAVQHGWNFEINSNEGTGTEINLKIRLS